MKFAIKCSYVEVSGVGGYAVAKDPITDKGKRNKPGRLKLVKDEKDHYKTLSSIDDKDIFETAKDELVTVYENGRLLIDETFENIRARCDIRLDQIDSLQTMLKKE